MTKLHVTTDTLTAAWAILFGTLLSAILLGASPSFAESSLKQDLALASVSAVAADLNTNEILIAKNSDAVLPIASITKVMTAMVVLDSGESLDAWLPIENWDSRSAKNAYSRIRLSSTSRRKDLLRIALMSSENRAAYNVAVHHPGGMQAFVAAMNTKASALGMTSTRFVDPTGLSPDNRSTTRDLVRMIAAAYDYEFIRDSTTTRQHSNQFRAPRYNLGYANTNPLLGSSRWNVSLTKTGYLSEAGRCLVMVAEMDGKNVAVALLNSFGKRSPLGDAGRIRRWLETGTESSVASAARDYENRMLKTYGLE